MSGVDLKNHTFDFKSSRMGRWSEDKINEWYEKQPWLVGCNFIPSTAINQLEMWQADTFDIETIDRELGWAASIGMNTIRVFLHDLLWLQDAEGFKNRIHLFLEVADRHGIKTMFVLFDDCWFPDAQLGKQPEPVPGIHNSGWLQSPGKSAAVDVNQEPRLKSYVQDIVGTFADDERVLMWDVYNELGNFFLPILIQPWYKKYLKLVMQGIKHLFLTIPTMSLFQKTVSWIREINPSQPITAGLWFGNRTLTKTLVESSDIISFHHYGKVNSLKHQIKDLKAYRRPLLCTEFLARNLGSKFETHLPVFKEQKVGCYNWGLVSGKTQTIFTWEGKMGDTEPKVWYHDIFRKDGTPFSNDEIEVFNRFRET